MKKNEYYRHKWNKYVSRITDVKKDTVELVIVNSGVRESIAKENFDANYESVTTIYNWKPLLEEAFSFATVQCIGDTIRIKKDNSILDFSVCFDTTRFAVCFTDDIKSTLNVDVNVLRFLVADMEEIIQMFANLFN